METYRKSILRYEACLGVGAWGLSANEDTRKDKSDLVLTARKCKPPIAERYWTCASALSRVSSSWAGKRSAFSGSGVPKLLVCSSPYTSRTRGEYWAWWTLTYLGVREMVQPITECNSKNSLPSNCADNFSVKDSISCRLFDAKDK